MKDSEVLMQHARAVLREMVQPGFQHLWAMTSLTRVGWLSQLLRSHSFELPENVAQRPSVLRQMEAGNGHCSKGPQLLQSFLEVAKGRPATARGRLICA